MSFSHRILRCAWVPVGFVPTGLCLLVVSFALLAGGSVALAAPTDVIGKTSDEDPDPTKPPEVQDAVNAFSANNVERAFELLKEAAKKYPNLPPARLMLANLYFSVRQPQIGRVHVELAVVENPDDPEPHLVLGELAERERRLSDAELQLAEGSRLLKELDAKKKDFDKERKGKLVLQYLSGRGQVQADRESWADVEKTLRELLKRKADHITARQRLAVALYMQKKTDEAEAELKQAVKDSEQRVAEMKKAGQTAQPLAPAAVLMANIVLNRSTAETREARVEEARSWLEKALKEAPNDARTELAMANFFLSLRSVNEADEHAKQAEKLDRSSVDVRLLCGQIARQKGEFARAEKYFNAIYRETPSHFAASNQLALVLAEQNDKEKKAKAFDIATINRKSDPKNVEAAATLGWVLYQQQRYDDAYEHLTAVMDAANQRAPISRDSLYYMARLAEQRGFKRESQQLLSQALEGNGAFFHQKDAEEWLKEQRK